MNYLAIVGSLESRTGVHVGTGRGGDVTDGLCRRDAAGNFILPGTGLAGVLRSLATRLAPALFDVSPCKALEGGNSAKVCGCAVCRLCGEVNPGEGDDEASGGRASRLFVAHARAALPSDRTPRIRDGVGIDRATRASARGGRVKFDLESLPRGTRFALRLEIEDFTQLEELLLAAVLAEWQAGRAWLGGRTSRGMGAFRLCDLKIVQRKCVTVGDLVSFLKLDQPWDGAPVAGDWFASHLQSIQNTAWTGSTANSSHFGVARNYVDFVFRLKTQGPFLINDPVASVRGGFDHAPVLDVVGKQGAVILPGASLRGALRSHAERIARTLATIESKDLAEFLVQCTACNPLESRPEKPLANCDSLLRKAGVPGKREVQPDQLCMACRLFGSTRIGSRLIVEDTVDESAWSSKLLDFLAIDRFTGGGKESAKFDAIAAWKPSFPIRLHLQNAEPWELGWLTLLLRDLAEGFITIGFGAAKGFGTVAIDTLTIDYGFLKDGEGPDVEAPESVSGVFRVKKLNSAVGGFSEFQQAWVDAFHKERRNCTGPDERATTDSYFGTEAETLYGKAGVA